MKKLLFGLLTIGTMSSAFALDVCEVIVFDSAQYNKLRAYSLCTNEKDNTRTPHEVSGEIAKVTLIKLMIEKGYEVKTDSILVKP